MKRIILAILGLIIVSNAANAMLAVAEKAAVNGARRVLARGVRTVACGSGIPWAEKDFIDTTDPGYQAELVDHRALAEIHHEPLLSKASARINKKAFLRAVESRTNIKPWPSAKVNALHIGRGITESGGVDTSIAFAVDVKSKGPYVIVTKPYSAARMNMEEDDIYGEESFELSPDFTLGSVLYPHPVGSIIAQVGSSQVFDLAMRLDGMAWGFERSPTVQGLLRMKVPEAQEIAVISCLKKHGVKAALAAPEREFSESWRIALLKGCII